MQYMKYLKKKKYRIIISRTMIDACGRLTIDSHTIHKPRSRLYNLLRNKVTLSIGFDF